MTPRERDRRAESPTSHEPAVLEDQSLRDRVSVFADREDAGRRLARWVEPAVDADALVLAIPAGGVPVAAALAEALRLELDVAVASKVAFHFEPEAGYGAVAFDGTLLLDDAVIERTGLAAAQVAQDVRRARHRVEARLEQFRGDRPAPRVADRIVCVVDDGLATGMTMRATLRALRAQGARQMLAVVPTGHLRTVRTLAEEADRVICLNIRTGSPFAVASAYRQWRDVPEPEAVDRLHAARQRIGPPRVQHPDHPASSAPEEPSA